MGKTVSRDQPACWITHPDCERHDMGGGHPESPARLQALRQHLESSGLGVRLRSVEAPLAAREALLRVHSRDLVEHVLDEPVYGLRRLDADTAMNEHSAAAALRAAGAGLAGLDELLSGRAGFVFCAVRPPGHHAERGRAMGFCLFNSAAVAVAAALEAGLQRVALLDFDVHYGNGSSAIFRHEPRVRVLNTYQDPLYPYWQHDAEAHSLIDVPLPPGCRGAAFRAAVEAHWLPALEAFAPELIVVSAGFDAHWRDPLAGLDFDDGDYAWIGERIREMADRHCPGRVLALLEGGYDLEGLASGVEHFVRAFVEQST